MLINAGLRRQKIVFVISIFSKTPFFWLLQYTPRRCFESFFQNALVDRGEGDQNRRSTVVGETMNLNELSGNRLQSRYEYKIYEKFLCGYLFNIRFYIQQYKQQWEAFFLSYCTPNLQCCNLKAIFPPLSAIQTNMR